MKRLKIKVFEKEDGSLGKLSKMLSELCFLSHPYLYRE